MKFSTAINVSEVQNAQEVWSNKKEKSQLTLNTESSPRCHVICESRVSHLVRNVVRPYFTLNFKELYKHIICSGLPDTGGLAHGALWIEEDAGHCSPMAKRRLHLHLSLYHCDIVIILSEKHPQFLTVPSSSSSVVGSASTQASPSLHIRLGAGFPPRAVQRTCGWEFIQGKSINTQHTIITITKQKNHETHVKKPTAASSPARPWSLPWANGDPSTDRETDLGGPDNGHIYSCFRCRCCVVVAAVDVCCYCCCCCS